MTLYYESYYMTLYSGDCLDILPLLEDQEVDAIITDPPYPHIKRDYGYWTEDEWFDMMIPVCEQSRRILSPQGSAIYILQPNSHKIGSMRKWLWEFMVYICDEWNLVQDNYWWNITSLPNAISIRGKLTRQSLKYCVWAGQLDCYREQENVLWDESKRNAQRRLNARAIREYMPSGQSVNVKAATNAAVRRGGVTPFNVLPLSNTDSVSSSGSYGHGAGTPLELADWWTRYIVPPNGVILDMFVGAGTMVEAGIRNGHHVIGIDKEERYLDMTIDRCEPIEEMLLEGTL